MSLESNSNQPLLALLGMSALLVHVFAHCFMGLPCPKHICNSEYEDVTGIRNKKETENNTYLSKEVWKQFRKDSKMETNVTSQIDKQQSFGRGRGGQKQDEYHNNNNNNNNINVHSNTEFL
jgi:hypothetical protein